jgi:hypothetical protein
MDNEEYDVQLQQQGLSSVGDAALPGPQSQIYCFHQEDPIRFLSTHCDHVTKDMPGPSYS